MAKIDHEKLLENPMTQIISFQNCFVCGKMVDPDDQNTKTREEKGKKLYRHGTCTTLKEKY